MNLTTYRNFDLLLTRAGARYRAIVVDAPAGEESVFFDAPCAADALPALAWDASAGLAGLGSRLFAAVFGGPVGTLLAASLASAAAEGAGLRLRLRVEEDAAELGLLPWEILYDPAQGQFTGLGETTPVLRYLALPRSRSALPVEPPLRVLALLASPSGLPALDVEREWQAIQAALAGLVGDGKFVLERLAAPTLDALQARLLREPVHILHFTGHGIFDADNQAGCLALADAQGRSHLVRGDDLAKLLRNHPALRLAYLNACEAALASGQSVFTGVAQSLVRAGVPAAVAMQARISDAAAVELARAFYTALAAGQPVDAALTQARVALSAGGSGEWAIPVLFSRSPDNRLFDLRQVLPTPECPYPGMAPFSEAQRDLFFGREREIEDAVARLRLHPFLAVIGPSGSGKSSLVNAGIIPALRRSGRADAGEWDIRTMRPGDLRTAAGQAAPMQALAALLGLASGTPVPACTSPTLLFVDQFEEVFTLAEAGEAQAFLAALAGLVGQPNLYILLTVRADFYPELMACTLWPPIRANRLELPPLGDDELWAAIVEPANRVGVSVDEALAVRLIADAAGERGSLPLVQETLVLLWGRVAERQLRLKTYQEMAQDGRSGLQVAIDRRASLVYANLPEAAQPIARRIFLRLVQFGEGRADTRRQQTVEELRAGRDDPALFDATLARLTAGRLLTAGGEERGARRVDIAHEALIAGWPRLQEWLGQRRAAEQTRRRLEAKAAEWLQAGRRGGLLDEYELQEARSWRDGPDAAELGISTALMDLIDRSAAALQAQARTRRRSQVVAVAAALVIAGLIIGTLLLNSRGQRTQLAILATAAADQASAATRQAGDARELAGRATAAAAANTRAIANSLVALGQAKIDGEPLPGMRLLFEGWRLSDPAERGVAESAIAAEMVRGRFATIGDDVRSLYPLAGGAAVLALRENEAGQLWRAADGAPETLRGRIRAARYSPDAAQTYLEVQYDDDLVELRRRSDGQAVPLRDGLVRVTYSPDPRAGLLLLAYADGSGELRLARDASLRAPLAGRVEQAFFSPDPAAAYAVVGYAGRPSELVQTSTGATLATFGGRVTDAVFSQDAGATHVVALYGEVGALSEVGDADFYRENEPPAELWRTADGRRIAVLANPREDWQGGIGVVAFIPEAAAEYLLVQFLEAFEAEVDPDHGTVAPAYTLPTVIYRSTRDGAPAGEEVALADAATPTIYRAPTVAGYTVIQPGSAESPAELHAAGRTTVTLAGPVEDVVFSPSGAFFVPLYASREYEVRRSDGSLAGRLDLGSRRCAITWLVFSPDERSLALSDVCRWYTTGWRQEVRSLDGTLIGELPFVTALDSATFSPDGRYLLGYAGDRPRLLYSMDTLAAPVSIAPDVRQVEFSRAAGARTFLGLAGGRLVLYDAATGAPAGAGEGAGSSPVSDLELSAGGRHLVVRRADDSSELWVWEEGLHLLASLGPGLAAYHFDAAESRIYIIYAGGRAEILDVNWLEALHQAPRPASVEEWERIFCQGPWRDAGLDEQAIRSLAGGAGLLSCAP